MSDNKYDDRLKSADIQKIRRIKKSLGQQVEESYDLRLEQASNKKEEQLVNIRVEQLALAKILVKLHGRPLTYLVKSHKDLGSAYLDNNCPEQAYEKLKIAYDKNKELRTNLIYERNNEPDLLKESQNDHLDVLKLLCKNCLILRKLRECSIYLDEAEELCQSVDSIGVNHNDYGLILEFKGDHLYYSDRFDEAIQFYKMALQKHTKYKSPPENLANCFKQVANVLEVQQKIEEALEFIGEAIDVILDNPIVDNRAQILIDLYMRQIELIGSLTQHGADAAYDKTVIESYMAIKDLHKELYIEKNDKRTLKALRNLAIIQSKKKMYEQALETIQEIEEVELDTWGDRSKHMAKTLTLKSTLLFKCGNRAAAKENMRRVIMIYEEIGDKASVKSVREKLKLFEEKK